MISFEPSLDGVTNMERDAALLRLADQGEPGARVYSWDRAWISLGAAQNAQRDLLDPDLLPWVMRPTGGRAVMHGHDVTIGLAVPLSMLSEEDISRSIKAVYRAIAVPIVRALKDCGLPAALAEDTPFSGKGPRSADCFAHVAPNDIVDERTGVKVCGVALKLTSRATLVQASIPNGPPLIDPARIFVQPAIPQNAIWNANLFPEAFESRLQELIYP